MSNVILFQVQLEHGGGHAEAGPWKVDIDHTSVKCREVESILVVATVTGEVPNTNVLVACLTHS
jgi:hypothetical protein